MHDFIINGTRNQKLIDFIESVYYQLGLNQYEDCLFELDFLPKCAGGAGGYCDGDDEYIQIEIARSDLQGRIRMDDLKINIAHEMIHAQQIASGRLINKGFVLVEDPIRGNKFMAAKQIWEGKEYVGCKYDEQPWEKEAYSLEKKVALAL